VLLGADHINLKPISGISAMTVAVSALSQAGCTVLNIGEADGGHGSTRFIVNQLGRHQQNLPFDPCRHSVDTDALRELVGSGVLKRPLLVYLDQFMCLFPHDLRAIRAAVGPDTVICYDGSHVLGLIAGGQFQNPLAEGADVISASTHKSFPGPHKGVLATNSKDLAGRIDEHAAYWVSHHHPADLAALAITVAELQSTARHYAAQTVANARALATALASRGFTVCGACRGFTNSHQVWIDIAQIIPPAEASMLLLDAGIVVNAIALPYIASGTGLRLGVQEVTWRGMIDSDMEEIAGIVYDILVERTETLQAALRVTGLLNRYPAASDTLLEPLLSTIHATCADGVHR
jgi:glycine/serine hydroxymethyltransferase